MVRLLLCLMLLASAFAEERPVSTKKFVFATGLSALPVYTDAALSTRFTEMHCQEIGNPWLYGVHPTPARMYPIVTGELALGAFASWKLGHSHGKWRKLWALPLAYVAGQHTYGLTRTVQHGCL